MEEGEKIILKNIRNGDRDTFRFLFDTYYKLLCLHVRKLTGTPSQAEDIAQNVFMNLWHRRQEIRINTSLQNYLYTSAYNLFVNDYRKLRREAEVLDKIHYAVLNQAISVEEVEIKRKLASVQREIQDLPPKSRKIFVMNKQRGLTAKEIAEILGLSQHTVESHIGRAMKRIRTKLTGPLP